jgi:DNA replication and repair protein RecF
LLPWDRELVEQGAAIADWRTDFLRTRIEPALARLCSTLVPELGAAMLSMNPGWTGAETREGLWSALAARIARDRERRQTGVGPHRADWRLRFEHAPAREHLSRGQEKLVALACTLAQVEVLHQQTREWPIVCFDDLPSELDQAHAEYALSLLRQSEAQIMVTGTHFAPELTGLMQGARVFHVEQGQFRETGSRPAA